MSNVANVNDLFNSAKNDDVLGDDALNALQVVDLGTKIGDALGIAADQFQQSEVVLVGVLMDDSGSIRFGGNTEAMADGHNCVIDALRGCKQQNNILFHSRLLSGTIINPFVSVDQAQRLTTGNGGNYNPNHGTPLFDEAVAFWGTMLVKAQEFSDQGVPCRTISLIATDGADVSSTHHYEHRNGKRMPKPGVKAIADDMLRQENHILAAMGIDDLTDPTLKTDFREIFREMGIRDEWVLLVANSSDKTTFQRDIRKACQVFSQSAVRASQSAASFSKQAIGGFGS